MTEKSHGSELAFVETFDEEVKTMIEKAFLKHGISYLIKVDKVRNVKKGRFESRKKYTFCITRFQKDEAKAAMEEQNLSSEQVSYLMD